MARGDFRGVRTPRRRKSWDSFTGSVLTLTANGTSIGSAALSFAESGRTIMRVLADINVSFHTAVSITASDSADITCGLAIVTADAFSAGAGSLPDPEDEPNFPWLMWKHINIYAFLAETSTQPFIPAGDASFRWEVDSRVMRKMRAGEALVWVVQYVDITGTPSVSVRVGTTRVLVALP